MVKRIFGISDDEKLSDHGQPLNRAFNAKRLTDRAVNEFIGICKGALMDGEVNHAEANFIRQWLERNRCAATVWPGNIIYQRVREMLCDNLLDSNEQSELLALLQELTGEKEIVQRVENMSTGLPLDHPAPDFVFDGGVYCFTGRFVYGPRAMCECEILERGGFVQSIVNAKVDYLVVGLIGSTDWAHSNYGRKIERAVELKEQGHKVAIVSEEHWTKHL